MLSVVFCGEWKMKKFFVLYTGGTIGMVQSEEGLKPDVALAQKALLPYEHQVQFDWFVCDPLIDSSAITLDHWKTWSELLQQKLPEYDGVLVLHGTDTLAYTANALALSVPTLSKPVVLTGAQKPFDAFESDAPKNLAGAVAALLRDDVHEVVIAFDGELFAAVGSNKVSTQTDKGFANAHFGVWKAQNTPLILQENRKIKSDVRVLPLLLIPGASSTQMVQLIHRDVADAIILLSYGHGNAPDDEMLLQAIEQFCKAGGLVLNISQVWQGCAAAVYAQGNALRRSGAVSGGKCNLETATALLTLAVSNGWTAQDLQNQLQDLNLI